MKLGTGWTAAPALAAALGAGCAELPTPEAPGAVSSALSTSVVISQVYGGGGNSGALYTHDFIELYNRGPAAVGLTGMSVQYASAGGSTWQVTNLSGTIQPGKYYLVQEASGTGGTQALPTPDATGTIGMSATAGKVALVASTTALTGACPTSASIRDLVGFGSGLSCFEGSGGTPAPGNNTSVLRKGGGCTETDDNAGDFATSTPPVPRNSAVTGGCGPGGTGHADPNPVGLGGTTLLTVAASPGTAAVVSVTADLTALLGGATQPFFDDGTHGDATAGDGVWSFEAVAGDAVGVQPSLALPFTVTDALAVADTTGSIALSVVANDGPTAVADTAATDEDVPVPIDVLANDTDPESDPLRVTAIVAAPAHGAAVVVSNGAFVLYMPAADYSGADGFDYRVTDSKGESDVGSVGVSVNPVNDPPSAAADAYDVIEDTTLHVGAPGVLANDSDVDSGSFFAVLVTDVAHGTLVLDAGGSFDYTPDADFDGTDSFTYRANDGMAGSGAVTVTLHLLAVNDAPSASADAFATDEDAMLAVAAPQGVLANDTDVDNPVLTAVLVTSAANGTLSLAANGSFTYLPDADFHGADSFVYHASDGAAASDDVTVTIMVDPVNDAPVGAPDAFTTAEDVPLTVLVAGSGLLANDADVDGDSLAAVLDQGPAHGTVELDAGGTFTWTPAPDFHGSDAFTYHVEDGATSSAAVTVSLTVASVNDAPGAPVPVLPVDGELVDRDVLAFTWMAAPDVDGDTLTYHMEVLDGGGSIIAESAASGTSTTIPVTLGKGAYSWRVRATDGELTGPNSTPASFRIKGAGGGGGGIFGCSTTGGSASPPGALATGLAVLAFAAAKRRLR